MAFLRLISPHKKGKLRLNLKLVDLLYGQN